MISHRHNPLPADVADSPTVNPSGLSAQLATYRVLSVRQPFASLIVSGRKWCENRTWQTRYRGPLLIHASSRVDREAVDELADELAAAGLSTASADLPTSAIVGAALLADVVNLDEMPGRMAAGGADRYASDPLFGRLHTRLNADPDSIDYLCGPECWLFDGYHVLPAPIPAKGRLNVWRHDLPAGLLPTEWEGVAQ